MYTRGLKIVRGSTPSPRPRPLLKCCRDLIPWSRGHKTDHNYRIVTYTVSATWTLHINLGPDLQNILWVSYDYLMAIFQFFSMAAAAIVQEGQTASLCQISLKSLQPQPRYRDFSIFRRWRPPPPWILKFQIFNGGDGQEGRTTSPRQISLKSAKTRPRYRDLSIFQDGGRRHLGF